MYVNMERIGKYTVYVLYCIVLQEMVVSIRCDCLSTASGSLAYLTFRVFWPKGSRCSLILLVIVVLIVSQVVRW